VIGKVYSMGRKEYGRLGLGEEGLEEKSSPTLITKLQNQKCIDVNCGSAVSYAVSEEGKEES
jgi:regulator of chromosome condensation